MRPEHECRRAAVEERDRARGSVAFEQRRHLITRCRLVLVLPIEREHASTLVPVALGEQARGLVDHVPVSSRTS